MKACLSVRTWFAPGRACVQIRYIISLAICGCAVFRILTWKFFRRLSIYNEIKNKKVRSSLIKRRTPLCHKGENVLQPPHAHKHVIWTTLIGYLGVTDYWNECQGIASTRADRVHKASTSAERRGKHKGTSKLTCIKVPNWTLQSYLRWVSLSPFRMTGGFQHEIHHTPAQPIRPRPPIHLWGSVLYGHDVWHIDCRTL